MDERNVRQVDSRLRLRATVAVDRDVANRLERFVCQRVLLTGDRIVVRVSGESALEGAVEIGPPDALQPVVELDRETARLDYGAQCPAHVHQIRVHVAVSPSLSGPG